GPGGTWHAGVPGPTLGRTSRGSETVLDGHRGWRIQRGGCGVCRGVPGGRGAMVPNSGRSATLSSVTLLEATLRAVFVVRGPGGDRAPACPGTWREGDRRPARTGCIDDFARVAPQRGYPRRHLHLPGDHGAVACGPSRPPSEAREAGHERETADRKS